MLTQVEVDVAITGCASAARAAARAAQRATVFGFL